MGDDAAAPGFSAAVEAWRPLVTKNAGDLPVNFLMAWISRESGGDPCSYTTLRESGIFQLMPPDNTNIGGTTEAALRAACSGGSHSQTRPLTEEESNLQVQSGVKYVNYARAVAHKLLDAAGVTWDETTGDFWSVVKLVFNYPGYIPGWLANATQQLGHPPTSWNEFVSTISGYVDILNNAGWVGAYGAGGGSLLNLTSDQTTVLLLGGLALAVILVFKKPRRR